MDSSNIRRNKTTGEVAILLDGTWDNGHIEVFQNEQAAQASISQTMQSQAADIPPLQNPITRGLQSLSQGVQNTLSPYIGDTASGLVSGLIPQSAPELAGEAALGLMTGGMGNVAMKAAKPLLKMGMRTLVPTLASSGTALVTGENPFTSGLATAAGVLAPEALMTAGKAGWNFAKNIVSHSKIFNQGVKDAKNLLNVFKSEAPHLPLLNKADGLFWMQDPTYGARSLKSAFDKVDNEISTALKGQGKMTVPVEFQKVLGSVNPAMANMKPGKRVMTQIDLENLPDAIKVIKEYARSSGDDAMGFQVRAAARAAEEQYKQILKKVNPNLVTKYEQAVADFDKGMQLINLLKKSKAVASSDQGPYLNMEALEKYVYQNVDKFPPTKYPGLWKLIGRGVMGASDVTKTVISGERALAGQGVRGSIPLPSVMTRRMAGQPYSSPFEGDSTRYLLDLLGIRAGNELTQP